MKLKERQKWRNERRKLVLRKELTAFEKEFRKNMVMLITGAFAFVAALFWRDAIKPLFEQFKPGAATISQVDMLYNIVAAFVVSIIAIIAIIFLSRLAKVEK